MTEPIEPGAPAVSLDHLARMFQQIDGEAGSGADATELRGRAAAPPETPSPFC